MVELLFSRNADIHRPWRLVSSARGRCKESVVGRRALITDR
jgi:hypothetical protein